MNGIYKTPPIHLRDGIPVFSASDSYVENYTTIAKDHLSALAESGCNPFIKEHLWREIEASTEDLIRTHIQREAKILDVGVGMGRLLERFPDFERFGMDISPDYLQVAKQKGIDVCLAKIEDMPYREEQFDMIISTDVLEHVIDLHDALMRILQVLKPGGIFIIRVPYKEDLAPYLSEDYPYELVHLRTFDKYSLSLILEKVFQCETLERSLSGFSGGRPHIPLPKKFKIRSAATRLLDLSRFTGKNMHAIVSRMTRRPTEINFVFKKTSNTGKQTQCAE